HAESPITGRRWTIEHGFIPTEDQFPRMRALGLTVTAQNHLYVAAPSLVSYWGPDRAVLTTPVGWYVSEEIPVSLGTDSPVIPHNPFWVLYHFATRGTISAGVMGPEHAVGRMGALDLMTRGYAFQVFEEAERGTLRPGMQADLTVLTGDYLTVSDASLQDLQSVLTVVGGRIVHQSIEEEL
ncbi:MAG: amidohydrolase family protein, partial [Gemmatimonadota bacterium]|nr:amidohydrolase family protein [Gemmatimonadota bacterium]